MDNSTPKDRAKILIEELKILQGLSTKWSKILWSAKMDSRARCGCFIPQNRGDLSSLWAVCFGDVVNMLLSFGRLLSHARKVA
ncbi:hypothetical protein HpMMM64_14630 [Helicobacter pylori]